MPTYFTCSACAKWVRLCFFVNLQLNCFSPFTIITKSAFHRIMPLLISCCIPAYILFIGYRCPPSSRMPAHITHQHAFAKMGVSWFSINLLILLFQFQYLLFYPPFLSAVKGRQIQNKGIKIIPTTNKDLPVKQFKVYLFNC